MSAIVLGNASSNFALELPRLRRTSEGWDEIREVIRHLSYLPVDVGDSRIVSGISGSFFVQEIQTLGCQLGLKVLEIVSLGLAGEKDVVWEPTSYGEQVSSDYFYGLPVPGAPTSPTRFSAQFTVPRVGMTARYISTTLPDQTDVGEMFAPAVTGGVPTYPLEMTPDLELFHYPYGWYLSKRDAQPLPQTTYYLVTDYFINQPAVTLKGG